MVLKGVCVYCVEIFPIIVFYDVGQFRGSRGHFVRDRVRFSYWLFLWGI